MGRRVAGADRAAYGAWLRQQFDRLDIFYTRLAGATACSAGLITKILNGERGPNQLVQVTALLMLWAAGAFEHPEEVMVGMRHLGYTAEGLRQLLQQQPPLPHQYWDAERHAATLLELQPQFLAWLRQAPAQFLKPETQGVRLPDWYVARELELAALRAQLLPLAPTAATVVLWGPGGSGKSLLAQALLLDPEVQRRYWSGVLWARLGPQGEPDACLQAWCRLLHLKVESTAPAVLREQLRQAVTQPGKRYLVVVDDVWEFAALEPLLLPGANLSWLFTTRDRTLITCFPDGRLQPVPALTPTEARALLERLAGPEQLLHEPAAAGDALLAVGLKDKLLAHLGDRKLLIFTEFKDTLDYLAGDGKQGRPLGKLREWSYRVITIDGSMGMDARIAAEHEFRDHAQIMVATEAAGEGINLQFCSLMVNYDIPWNPNRLEQRMGRIHRYGQQHEVFVWNLITQDTREGQILDRLFEKLNAMRKALGSDRVFDIIGDLLPGTRLDELLRDAIFSQRRLEEIEQHIEAVDEGAVRRTLDEVFLTGLATRHIDYTGLLKETLAAEENRLVPEHVGDYFLRAFRRLGGTVERRADPDGDAQASLYAVPSMPFDLRQWGEDYGFKTTYGALFREYRRITFDKAYAQRHREVTFVAPGHPLLEALNETILRLFAEGAPVYVVFGDPEGQRAGVLWFMTGAVRDGSGQAAGQRVFCLYQPVTGPIQPVNPAILWDLEPLDSAVLPPDLAELLGQRAEVEDHVITAVLFPYLAEIEARREHEAAIKEKYGLRSLDYLIQESNQKILDYQLRQAAGETLDLPLLNEQRNLDQLEVRRRELEAEIRMERNLTVDEPRFLGAAVVTPLRRPAQFAYPEPDTGGQLGREAVEEDYAATMHRDPEAEAVGMRVALAYERAQGWHPEDVAAENLGFDVRSTRYHEDGTLAEIRYIEVKARARTGAVRISANEWKKARHFGAQFWLYVVTGAKTETPELHRIQNPADQFRMDEDILATGYIIQKEAAWRDKRLPGTP